jgi:ADP-ribosylglycohydrolase
MANIVMKDRIAGCLLAGALGDAIGASFENAKPSDAFSLPSDLRVTDDTQLTLATCEAIIETGSVEPESIARHFVQWFRDRRLSGIGASTLKALTELDAGGHWATVGATGEYSAGNGAAMRIAPLAFFLDPDEYSDRRTVRDVCRITHRNEEAYIGALAILRSIRHVLDGHPLDDGLPAFLVQSLPDSRVRDRLISVRDSSPTIAEYALSFGSSGYVVDSVPLAILAATRSTDVLDAIARIVQCGGDTDTVASMFGQLFGTAVGVKALPAEVVDRIDMAPTIRRMAIELSRIQNNPQETS